MVTEMTNGGRELVLDATAYRLDQTDLRLGYPVKVLHRSK